MIQAKAHITFTLGCLRHYLYQEFSQHFSISGLHCHQILLERFSYLQKNSTDITNINMTSFYKI